MGDGRSLLVLSAVLLVESGAFAIFQAATGNFLPHDTVYLGMTASELCARQGCRILHFMIHDRVSFGGVLVAIGVLYLWLSLFPLRRRESWAWWALAFSSLTGFLSFLSYLGYGYLDTWHGAATLALAPLFVVGLARTRRLRRNTVAPNLVDLRSGRGLGRALLLLSSIGISAAGLTITIVGMTSVFVPQDLEFIGMTRAAVSAINPHLVPLIAHVSRGFGRRVFEFRCGNVGLRTICASVTVVAAGINKRGSRRIRCSSRRASGDWLSERHASGAGRFRVLRVRGRSGIGCSGFWRPAKLV